MPAIKYLPVSWTEYHTLAQSLAAKILSSGKKPDQMVAIARGGLTLGHLISDLLSVPVSTITIQSYTDIQKQGEVKITGKLQSPIRGKHILVVDDVSDSGKTLKRAVSYLRLFHPETITTATLFYKVRSSVKPDFFAQETDQWILFPYEITEWVKTFTQKMMRENKPSQEIHSFLTSLGYTDNQIAFGQQQIKSI